ncbi:MAG: 50S ribosomal protein L21 [Candidatus Omnitrophica bacterium]|jgi:large subunit ribosomal protein L21|nr:50S ribosomal protein L21 [Candidatus Omnitrophota bacterium]
MYAVIEVGSKQYLVKKGDTLEVERQGVASGQVYSLDKVLLLSNEDKIEVGTPYVKGATVKAKVLKEVKTDKAISFKYRRRKSSHWKKAHRQKLSLIEVEEIKA